MYTIDLDGDNVPDMFKGYEFSGIKLTLLNITGSKNDEAIDTVIFTTTDNKPILVVVAAGNGVSEETVFRREDYSEFDINGDSEFNEKDIEAFKEIAHLCFVNQGFTQTNV